MSEFNVNDILAVMDEAAQAIEPSSGYSVLSIIERSQFKELLETAQTFLTEANYLHKVHSDDFENDLKTIDLVLLECRLIEGLQDLNLIERIRTIRPQVPILVLSVNDDPEYISSVYEAGANDAIDLSTDIRIFYSKANNLLKTSKVMGLVEFKNDEVVKTMESLRVLQSHVQQEKVSRILAETQRDFAEDALEANRQMKEILDNLREAFFFVKPDLVIGDSTSNACETIFGRELSHAKIGDALGLCGCKEKDLMVGLEQVFEDFLPEEVSISLLPQIVHTESQKTVEFGYTAVRDADGKVVRIIIVATDITRSFAEKQLLEKSYRENRCLINILRHMDSFTDFVRDFKSTTSELKIIDDVKMIKHALHTLKGNSLVFELHELGKMIHDTETLLEEPEERNWGALVRNIEDCLHNFLNSHEDLLQIDFLSNPEKIYHIHESDVESLDKVFSEMTPSRQSLWKEVLARIKHKSIGELCAPFTSVVSKLSARDGKDIAFSIFGEELRLDIEPYRPLFKTMVHLVSNACDHGIEPPYERDASGKPGQGNIILTLAAEDDKLQISLADDGRGIEWQDLINKAREKGFSDQLEKFKITEDNAYEILFWDGFSTAESVSQTSGRGVGMSALKHAVETLGGSLFISSAPNFGTCTEIEIPLHGALQEAS